MTSCLFVLTFPISQGYSHRSIIDPVLLDYIFLDPTKKDEQRYPTV